MPYSPPLVPSDLPLTAVGAIVAVAEFGIGDLGFAISPTGLGIEPDKLRIERRHIDHVFIAATPRLFVAA